MELLLPALQAYAERFTTVEDDVLRRIRESTAGHPELHMLSGHLQGKLLELLSKLTRPERILEIGTFTGYSAVCLSRGLAPGGRLHTIESREETAEIARANFNLPGAGDKIILHTGNAAAIIPTINETWDMVFMDADKTGYTGYYQMVLPRLRKGGLLLADNVFFHGTVLSDPPRGKNARAIQAFNEMVQQDPTVEQVVLTVRDGLMLVVKK